MDPKFKGGSFKFSEVIEILDADRCHLESLNCNRAYGCVGGRLRPLPRSHVPTELDPCLSDDSDGKILV